MSDMRLVYACLDPFLSDNVEAAAGYAAQASALAAEGNEVIALCMGGEGRLPGVSRTVRLRPSNAGRLVADHVAAGEWESLAAPLEIFWNNDKLIRALRIEHQRAPLDAVVERMTPFTFAMQALCTKLGVHHVFEVRPPAVWDAWARLDLEGRRLAHAVHLFAARRTDMIFAASEGLASEYRDLTPVPVRTLADHQQLAQPARRRRARRFTVGVSGPLNRFADLPLLQAAEEHLPEQVAVSVRERELVDFDAGLILPASRPDGNAARLSRYVAAGVPVVVSAGSLGDRLLPPSRKAVYEIDDPRSLAAAMIAASRLPEPSGVDQGAPSAWDIDAALIVEGLLQLGRRR